MHVTGALSSLNSVDIAVTDEPASSDTETSPAHTASGVRHAIEQQAYVKLLRSHRGWRVLAVLGAAGIVIIALLGGFRSATPTTTGAAHAPGKPLELGAYTVTALSASVGPSMPGQSFVADNGTQYLSVKIRVVNDSDSGTYMGPNLKSSLVLLGEEGMRETPPDDLVWADTGSRDLVLPPHLAVEFIAVWELRPGTPATANVAMGAYKVSQGISRISLAPEWARGPRAGYWLIPVAVVQ